MHHVYVNSFPDETKSEEKGGHAKTKISPLFGRRHGIPITNKRSILPDLDAFLGNEEPPDVEYILVQHALETAKGCCVALGSQFGRFGHAVVRYTLPLDDHPSDAMKGRQAPAPVLRPSKTTPRRGPSPSCGPSDDQDDEEPAGTGTPLGCAALEEKKVLEEPSIPLRHRCVGQSIGLDGIFRSKKTGCLKQQVVMNIAKGHVKSDAPHESVNMVNFLTPEEYLFGCDEFELKSFQGGVYNREYFSVRLQNVPPGAIRALHAYYLAVDRQTETKVASFVLVGGRVQTLVLQSLPLLGSAKMSGNCAFWTSGGLVAAGLLRRRRIFPKAVFVELFEQNHRANPANVKIVRYREVPHAHKHWGLGVVNARCIQSPLYPLACAYYLDLSKFADAVVSVPAGSMTAVITSGPAQRPCANLFWAHSHSFTIGTAAPEKSFMFFSPWPASPEGRAWFVLLLLLLHAWLY